MGWHHDWMGGLGGFMFPGFGLIIIVVLVVIIVWALAGGRLSGSQGGTSDGRPTSPDTPLEIVRKRYARGEITREEFERMKKDLLE
jgi:putative membrane protein